MCLPTSRDHHDLIMWGRESFHPRTCALTVSPHPPSAAADGLGGDAANDERAPFLRVAAPRKGDEAASPGVGGGASLGGRGGFVGAPFRGMAWGVGVLVRSGLARQVGAPPLPLQSSPHPSSPNPSNPETDRKLQQRVSSRERFLPSLAAFSRSELVINGNLEGMRKPRQSLVRGFHKSTAPRSRLQCGRGVSGACPHAPPWQHPACTFRVVLM